MQARDSCVVACAVAMKGLHPSARLGVERETHTTMALRAGPNAFDHGSSLGSASRQAMGTHAHLLAARTLIGAVADRGGWRGGESARATSRWLSLTNNEAGDSRCQDR
jgi:hypothetical protein